MINPSVTTVGFDQLVNNLTVRIPQRALANGARVLHTAANETIADAQQNYVPVLTGLLLRSGRVNEPEFEGASSVSVAMGFGAIGSGAEGYAVEQHEFLFYRHFIGGPKFLEIPTLKMADQLPGRLAPAIYI